MAPPLESYALRNELDQLRRRVAHLERHVSDGTFNPYSVALTASSVDPTLGTGATATGTYARLGDLVLVLGDITFGSAGVAAGTGSYRISLPVQGADTTEAGANVVLGRWRGTAGANTFEASGVLVASAEQYMVCRYPAAYPTGTDTLVGAAAPWAWAANNRISFTALYRAAPY